MGSPGFVYTHSDTFRGPGVHVVVESVVVCVTVEVAVVGVPVAVGTLQFSATKRKMTCLLLIFKKSRIRLLLPVVIYMRTLIVSMK